MDAEGAVGTLRFPFGRGKQGSFSLDISISDFSRLEQIAKRKGWTVGESLKQCLMSGLQVQKAGVRADTPLGVSSDKLTSEKQDDLRTNYAILTDQENQLSGTNGGLNKVYEEESYNNTLLVLSLTGNKASIRDYNKLLGTEGDGELDEDDRYFMDAYLMKKT